MTKFFNRLGYNFMLSFVCVGFAAILSNALTGEPFGVGHFWIFTVMFSVIYMISDYIGNYVVARRNEV